MSAITRSRYQVIDKMIFEEETHEVLGYYSTDLPPKSEKDIISACTLCGEFRITSKHHYYTFCNSCSQILGEKNKGEKHPMFGRRGDKCPTFGRRGNKCPAFGRTGDKNPNWQGGISFEPYCIKFNDSYKREVRKLFGNICFLCGKTEEENEEALSVHHVNYNKQCGCDGTICVCVPLCVSCHAKTGNNRKYWERKIKNKLRETLLGY